MNEIHYHVTTMECDITWCKHSTKTDLLSIWSSAKYKNTYNHHCHHESRHDLQHPWFLWRLEGHWERFDGLVVRTFLSENCYTLLLTLVQ